MVRSQGKQTNSLRYRRDGSTSTLTSTLFCIFDYTSCLLTMVLCVCYSAGHVIAARGWRFNGSDKYCYKFVSALTLHRDFLVISKCL